MLQVSITNNMTLEKEYALLGMEEYHRLKSTAVAWADLYLLCLEKQMLQKCPALEGESGVAQVKRFISQMVEGSNAKKNSESFS